MRRPLSTPLLLPSPTPLPLTLSLSLPFQPSPSPYLSILPSPPPLQPLPPLSFSATPPFHSFLFCPYPGLHPSRLLLPPMLLAPLISPPFAAPTRTHTQPTPRHTHSATSRREDFSPEHDPRSSCCLPEYTPLRRSTQETPPETRP